MNILVGEDRRTSAKTLPADNVSDYFGLLFTLPIGVRGSLDRFDSADCCR